MRHVMSCIFNPLISGGGSITFNEFSKAFLKKDRKHSVAPERVKEVFDKVDKDKSGALTKSECVEAMKMLGKNMDDSGIERIMQVMDKSNDGGVSFQGINEMLSYLVGKLIQMESWQQMGEELGYGEENHLSPGIVVGSFSRDFMTLLLFWVLF